MDRRDPEAIRSYRLLAEARLSDLLKQSKSTMTLDDITRSIFESDHNNSNDHLRQLIALFPTSESTISHDVVLATIADAWTYFPHRSLAMQFRKSPASNSSSKTR